MNPTMKNEAWPELPYEAWKDTYATLHMWTQMVGKIALATAPHLNHSWGVALHVTPRGLSTGVLAHDARTFTIEFDFVDHQLVVRASDGAVGTLPLEPRSVAAFYRALTALLDELALSVRIWTLPAELAAPVRFERDEAHHAYDPEYANRCWRILTSVDRVFEESRTWFVGKTSPSHFFWGAFDLAVTRFSGRPAPPREGPAFMREAYSHEVISHGFWPGGPPILKPVFYSYAVPEPTGFKTAKVGPAAAYYHAEMGEFILPYDAVRTASDPADALRAFIRGTYEAGATLGGWDRAALERR
jgi:Family of unknown function (DUF5996)